MKSKSRFLNWLYSPVGEAVFMSVTGIIGLSAFLWVALSARNQHLVFCASLVLYLTILFLTAGYIRKPHHFLKELKVEVAQRGGPDFYLVAIPMGLFGAFVTLVHSIAAIWPDDYFEAAVSAPPTSWILYGLDNVIRAALLDFGEIYFIDISGIDHKRNMLACTLVFSFRTILSVGLITLLFRAWKKTISQTETKSPTRE